MHPPIIDFFMEQTCPICRRLNYAVLEKLEIERVVIVDRIDVDTARGTYKWQKWKRFCNFIGYEATPVIMVGQYIFMTWKTREKPLTLTEKLLSSMDYFEMQLRKKLKELQKYPVIQYANSYEMDCYMSVVPELQVRHNELFKDQPTFDIKDVIYL
jgi:hypothetical protein